ncbi:hypothetical protein U0070_011737 [Myodes glareolus]|uniref:Uncharacterized protein n=1 Tax=Myodes glareolus TaxID=447135 RepID=A0AAW0HV50_MYOGA
MSQASRLDKREAEDDILKVGDGARNLRRKLPSPPPLLTNSAVHTEKVLECFIHLQGCSVGMTCAFLTFTYNHLISKAFGHLVSIPLSPETTVNN